MNAAPTTFHDAGAYPRVARLQVAGTVCTGILAGGTGASIVLLHGQKVPVLAMRLGTIDQALFQPLTRETGEALIASLRRALDECGL